MEGNIEAYIDRSPNFIDFYYLLDKTPSLLVAKENDKLVGCLGSTHFPAYIGDKNVNMSIWGDFKVAPESRGGRSAIDLFNAIYDVDLKKDNDFAVVSILKGNEKSLSFTKGKGKVPKAQQIDDYMFCTVLPAFKRRVSSLYSISNPKSEDVKSMVKLYNDYNSNYNLSTRYTEESFLNTIDRFGLSLNDFYISKKGSEVVGVIAAWDQFKIQRYIVNKYSFKIRLLTYLYKILGVFMKTPPPPKKEMPLRFLFLSLYAYKHDEEKALDNLVRYIHNKIRGDKYSFYNICFREQSGLSKILKGTINSAVYTHNFAFCTNPDKNIEDFDLTSRPCHIEYATLV